MKITNKLNLPEEIVNAVDVYQPSGNYSASMLNKSPRMVWLGRRHFAEMEEDVTDRIWSLFGTAVHKILSHNEAAESISEEYMKYEFGDGSVISGMADVYSKGKISDWKVKSVWSVIYMNEDDLKEFESQLNVYAFLFRKYGFEVSALEIVMILRDWQRSKAKYDSNYPQTQVHVLPVELWDENKAEAYIIQRISAFQQYKNTPDNELPECEAKDRWAKPGKWALMKNGRKTAVKLYDEKPEGELKPDHYWQERPGDQWVRCEYCNAKPFCNQWAEGNK
jgi:hypothetical protein